MVLLFFFNDTATTEIYTLSLHDALPISPPGVARDQGWRIASEPARTGSSAGWAPAARGDAARARRMAARSTRNIDRKSTRLNSSHANISYAVFCLKKKKNRQCKLRHYNN